MVAGPCTGRPARGYKCLVDRCARCGASVGEGHRFCGNCGAPVGGCPACGEPVIAGNRFCHACGHALAELAPASPVTASAPPGAGVAGEPVAERRVCSVLFCDLVGFTPLSEARDPEAVRELLSEYFAVARTVIGRYGGVVEKFIGDAVMAVWGTPAATEGDAERAVRAALDLVAAVAELGAEAGVPGLAARAGVVTGEVAVTLGAVGEGMVAGDAVNTAARVQAAAEPGQVLVDGATQRLAGGAVGFADAGEHALKGKAEPARLWRATRVLAGVGGSQRVDGLEAPLTGRDAELRTVRELFHAAAERRVPRLVLVSGPAGVGKSRLGWEFEKYADGLAARGVVAPGPVPVLRGGGGVLGAGRDRPAAAGHRRGRPAPRWPRASWPTGWTGSSPIRASGRMWGRGWAGCSASPWLGMAGPRWRGRSCSPGGGCSSSGWRREQPVVLLVEDAQYADAGLLDFLDHLIDWVRDLPIYVLVFARPELGQARPGFGTGRNRSTLTLDPLDAASMDQLVDALVPGMPAAARAKITGQAQGIPLFAVETVRSLIDRDIVQPVEGAYRLVGDVGELAVPDSLHALLAARLDALDPDARRLVADAAVLGTTFPAEALIAVSGQDEAMVRAALAELVRREVLQRVRRPAVAGAGQLPVRPGHAAPGRLRHLVPPGPQGPAPDGGRAPARRVPRRRGGGRRGHRPALPGRAAGRARRPRHRADPRPGHRRADPGRRARRAHRRPGPGRRQLRRGRRPDRGRPAGSSRSRSRAAVGRPAVGTRRHRRRHQRRLCPGHRAGGPGPRVPPAGRAGPGGGPGPGHRRARRCAFGAGMAEAREQLTAALEVLRADPDTDTVRALCDLASVEVFAGSPDADRLSAEALSLGQALGVGADELSRLFSTRGVYLASLTGAPRRPPTTARARGWPTRPATACAWDVPCSTWRTSWRPPIPGRRRRPPGPPPGTCAGPAPGTSLAYAIGNLAQALLMLGDWDAADAELTQAADSDGLAGDEFLACYRGWLAALRGDAATAQATLAGLADLRASEDPQDKAMISLVEGFTAAARRQPQAALRHARAILAHAGALGISHECLRWAWPLAARAAHDLRDTAAAGELLALLDACQPGHLRPDAAGRTRPGPRPPRPPATATRPPRPPSPRRSAACASRAPPTTSPTACSTTPGTSPACAMPKPPRPPREARDIADRLRCQPLLDRAADLTPAAPPLPTRTG